MEEAGLDISEHGLLFDVDVDKNYSNTNGEAVNPKFLTLTTRTTAIQTVKP